ncbi:MAG: hypothetical protein ABJA94_07520 [Rhodoglobus sp.]
MKHVTYADKSLLIGDEAATTLLQYAAMLGSRGAADTVTLKALDGQGNDVEAIFLLNSGTVMIAETGNTTVPEPDNAEATDRMKERIRELTPSEVLPLSADDILSFKGIDNVGLE